MATYTGALLEFQLPGVKFEGLKTNKDVSVGDGATVTLPSTTTIGGSSVVALGNITSSATTGVSFSVTNTGIYTGTGAVTTIADSLTTGTASLTSTNGQTSGHNTVITSSGTIVAAGDLLSVIGNSATTSTGLVRVSATGMTSGSTVLVTGGGANMTSAGVLLNMNLGAATAGSGLDIVTTGVYTDTTGLLSIVANSATTGTLTVHSGTGITTGKIMSVVAAAATLTTGRYVSCSDGALEVFGVGADGHIHTGQTTAPTIVVTTQAGITAAAVTAGASDTCGVITTTGTSTGATILDVTFNKTYTTAPKIVLIAPANAAASMPNTSYFVSAISATGFTITVAAGGTYAATPSWRYLVIA